MEKFKISDIQEIFVSDVERFHNLTQQHVQDLLEAASPAQESLDEALRQCHTLKGLAGSVEAWGLSCLGADLEKLLELAGSWMHNERERANQVFEFILEHMQDWYVMNQFSCMDMLPQAWDIYQGLRVLMEDRWPGCLPVFGAEAGAETVEAQYVRLANLEITEVEQAATEAAPVADAASTTEALTPELDVQGAAPLAGITERAQLEAQGTEAEKPSGAPLPVRVVPPTLRHRDQTATPTPTEDLSVSPNTDELQIAAASTASEPVAHVEQPAAPKPLQVVPPALRRRKGAEAAKPEPAQAEAAAVAPVVENISSVAPATVAPTAQTELPPTAATSPVSDATPVAPTEKVEAAAAPTTPPILRVAPPALKRRGKKPDLTTEAVTPTAPTSAESLPVQPLAVESAADAAQTQSAAAPTQGAESISAEALFASLPEAVESEQLQASVEPTVTPMADAKSGAEFQPGADKDLLAMLSQEVAGYLAELTESLLGLAGDLAAAEPWGQARRLFHTIKGTAATFGLDAVSGPAKAAELRAAAAYEDGAARSREVFEDCVHRAGVIAKALGLPFDEGRLREALRAAEAHGANVAALRAAEANVEGAAVSPLDPELVGFFINDSRDQIGVIEEAVLRWERLPARRAAEANMGEAAQGQGADWSVVLECVQAAQRGFHTIKGAGNSIGLTGVAGSVHEVEAFLEGVAARGAKGSKAVFTFLLGAVDQLRGYLVELGRNTAAPWRHDWSGALQLLDAAAEDVVAPKVESAGVVAAASSVEAGEDAQTLRIETARLHELMNLIGELMIDRARLARKIEQLAGLHRALAERNGALSGSVLLFKEEFEFNLGSEKKLGVRSENLESSSSSLLASGSSGHGHGEFSEMEFDRYDQFNVLARSLVEVSHDIEVLNGEVAACLESFTAENVQFAQTSRELQGRVTGLSLVPVNGLFPRLQRAFRDALGVECKEGDLVFAGGESLLDKVVVDRVYGPLLHLVRNAVAHGIEDAVARAQRQKPARGQVRLTASQASNQIVLVLSDDGAGVDVAAVRARAIEKGWLEAAAPELTPEQVVEFIFRPGFSTAARVTSVSGRGIGLDVVRQEIENLNGSVELKWVAGVGTSWTLRLPLTLSISEAILTVVGETQFAFPLNFVEAGLILEENTRKSELGMELYPVERRGEVETGNDDGRLTTPHQNLEDGAVAISSSPSSILHARSSSAGGELPADAGEQTRVARVDWLPVLRLSRMFGLAGNEQSNKGLIVGVGERRAIVVVDTVLARQEVVVKELDAVMVLHPLLNGASLDAEGRVIPILNLPTLLKYGELVRGGGLVGHVRLEQVKRVEQTRVLVVDDSLSVRKVQERFLRELGCTVAVAKDGLEALERLREGATPGAESPFDFIFTDLEMPRMNGYELISEVRGNPAWSKTPLVVISSRGADKYITKAMNLGASTFLSKPFTQQQLRQVLEHYARVEGATA